MKQNKVVLSAEEREMIAALGDYKPDDVEEWLNRDDSVFANAPAALTACVYKGYYGAVRAMARTKRIV